MHKMIAAASAALFVASFSAAPALAKHRVHNPKAVTTGTTSGAMTTGAGVNSGAGTTTGMARGNAALGGNNANSASGSNSLTNPKNAGSTGSGL
ncbi:MAG: hypothetical protein JWR89_404 [Tardiphaga sp.]|uniref:hypothetical protein n=1 Tax=Tardiphaga sp. TaxID=1926292 RepID=UPI00260BB0B5|nr:hypothetical protein [Tardiphaga sp.]MDB5500502.1 hypothetical protein [Tardiphaga sp.]